MSVKERECQSGHSYTARDDVVNPRCHCGAPPKFRPQSPPVRDGGLVEKRGQYARGRGHPAS